MNISSDCVDVSIQFPDWSDHFGKDCVNLTSTIEELYSIVGDLKESIDTSMFDSNGIDYGSDRPTVSQILRVHENKLFK